MTSLKGHVAIISGGLGDIGRAIVRELARNGADISIGDVHQPSKASKLLLELKRLKRKARYDCVDVADANAVEEWVLSVEKDLGTPTLIIPNAAVVTLANVRTITPAQWNREIRINLDGVFHLAQAGARRLLRHKKQGRIVFIGSWVGHRPISLIPAYCVSKAGLRMLCQCMALELAPYGILVNEVAPGYVDAGLTGRIFDRNPSRRARAKKQVPIQKLIQADDVAFQVAHLCDPRNQHMTGTVLVMDGGLSLRS